jgi:quinohemoprotein ethanol dehydrogenase
MLRTAFPTQESPVSASARLLALFLCSSLAGCAFWDDSGAPLAPSTSSPPDVEWTLHGLDPGDHRFSGLKQIGRENVRELGLAWSADLRTYRGVEATPLVVDGTLYVTSGWSVVYAFDATTGEQRWVYDPEVPRSFLAKGCCDAVNRGVAYQDGQIFVGSYDGRLVALDAKTGAVAWDVQTTDREQPYTITGAPRIAGDVVVIGNGGAELGVRGYVTAYDQTTGEQSWRFYTVPGDPAAGFENEAMERAAETWTGEWWKWGGGGTVWDAMTYDPGRDLGLHRNAAHNARGPRDRRPRPTDRDAGA